MPKRLVAETRRFGFGGAARLASVVVVLAFVVGAMTDPSLAQRAVLIIDGERIEIDFNEVDRARFNLARSGMRADWPQPEVALPSDAELQRVTIDGELLSLVAALDGDTFAAREAAMQRLREAEFDDEQFYAILAHEPLTLEQRNRLLLVVRDRLLAAPRGALGISMPPRQPPLGGPPHVEVAGLIPGLPAERVLKVGDLITHIDGEPVRSSQGLVLDVQSRRPGDQVTLTILRPERDEQGRLVNQNGQKKIQELEVEMMLGSADKLVDPRTGQQMPATEIERMRRYKADLVQARFGPRQTTIEIEGDLSELRTGRKAPEDVESRVERHPLIQEILQHRRMIERADLGVPQVLREQWERTREDLKRLLTRSDMATEDRQLVEGVLKRFTELMLE